MAREAHGIGKCAKDFGGVVTIVRPPSLFPVASIFGMKMLNEEERLGLAQFVRMLLEIPRQFFCLVIAFFSAFDEGPIGVESPVAADEFVTLYVFDEETGIFLVKKFFPNLFAVIDEN